ncbi:Cytochrome P450 [Arabidopsis thaliana x Arabidopsis arenosa]|uniref:Cytochrome P450 n=1 Tax=Arabidopsis thaliana x Arabidopsis arenosa TaxID=1240361 RepID=A0A8T2BGT2_9BRAS|nr:Cytochrome P450 [Arabidopsis thaliana x Arabidopsis arenosa]
MAMLGLLELFVAFLFSLVFLFTCFFLHKKPRGQPILKNWPFLGMLPGMLPQIPRIYDWTVEVLEASNLTFYFKGPWLSGTDMLFTADPRNINHILSSNFGNYPKGPEFKKIFDVLGEGILTVDLELWEDLRKSNHAMFHNQDFLELSLSSNKSKLKEGLVPFLDNAAHENIIIDLQDVFMRFMFDTSSILMTGYDPMSLSIEMLEVEFGEAADIGEEAIYYRHFKPVMLWRLQNWLGIGLERKMRTALATVNRMFAKIISTRRREEISREKTEPSKDALTYYMNVDTTKYKLLKPKNDTFIRDVIFSLVLAGRDTTSSALTWFFWLLSKHPQVMAKIRHEINTKYDPADLEKLVYLHAALSESMRLYPPLPFNHKAPAKPDVLPSGHKVEPESKIVICIYALGRMRSVWGEDASDFKPERWISDNGGLRHEPSYKYVAFNSGPRTCLGKHLALLQMKIVALEIIKNYDFKVIEGHKIEAIPSILLRMKHGLKVTVTKKI